MKTLGLYVHIPFCIKKCLYCDFNSYESAFSKERAYFDALFSEIERKSALYKNYACDSVYIGGGTPTAVKTENIEKLIKVLKKNFNITVDAEINIECNPKTAGKEDFLKLKNAGINRVSIGVQSLDDEVLKRLGRIHSASDAVKCLSDARLAGFSNISCDLMFALPGQDLKLWEETLYKTIEQNPAHISCYALKIEENTPFYHMDLKLPAEEEEAKMYERAVKILAENGYMRYEISNFAKEGKQSRHNLKYWSLMPYLGLGAGAYSSIDGERFKNPASLDEYIKGEDKKEDYILLSKEELMSEYMFMGLRKTDGVSEEEFLKRFGESIFEHFEKPLKKYLSGGILHEKNGRIYLNEKMFYISNIIVCDFV